MGFEMILLLYAVGIVLIVAEVFLPGGFIGMVGILSLLISIYFGFSGHGVLFGIIQLAVTLIIIPIAFYFGLKRLSLKKSLKTEDGFTSPRLDIEALLDKEGVALTNLRPSGTAVINDRKIDVVTEGGMIDKNTPIKVIRTEGVKVIVRAK
jgi:membrane-bound serine protease (ClpP class)